MTKKISQLPAASAAAAANEIEINEAGTSKKITITQLTTLLDSATQTLTNKTLDANGTGNSITNIENADVSATAGIVASKLSGVTTPSSTDTFTNKTFDVDGTGNSLTNIANANIKAAAAIASSKLATVAVAQGGTGVTSSTGTVNVVLSNSPTLVTPALGTPASGVLTNCTGLPTAGLVDDAVTLAKMASGTDGNLITYDTSGDPAAVATGTAAQVLTSNGAGTAPTFQAAAGGGGFSTVFKSADETIQSDATLTDDTDLQFSVDANSFYSVMGYFKAQSGSTPDYKQAFSVPAGANFHGGNRFTDWTSDQTDEDYTATQSVLFAGNEGWLCVVGILEIGGTAGTCAYQWAQNNSFASDTTLFQGSWLMFRKN